MSDTVTLNSFCFGCDGAKDMVFVYLLNPGDTITLHQSVNDYTSSHELRHSGSCPGTQVVGTVLFEAEETPLWWTNTDVEPTNVYYIQSGMDQPDHGSFTLHWEVASTSGCASVLPLQLFLQSLTAKWCWVCSWRDKGMDFIATDVPHVAMG